MNAMKRAWEIRKAAAKKWNCEVMEIVFSECLRMAHAGQTVDDEKFEKPNMDLINKRIPLAMAYDKTNNPNNASTSNIFRNLKAAKELKSFDNDYPEVIGWLIQTFGAERMVIA